GPVPHCDHNVALFTLRPLRLNGRQFAAGNSIRPICVHLQGTLPANLREPGTHAIAGLARLKAAIPGGYGVGEFAEGLRNLTCRPVAQLMQAWVGAPGSRVSI